MKNIRLYKLPYVPYNKNPIETNHIWNNYKSFEDVYNDLSSTYNTNDIVINGDVICVNNGIYFRFRFWNGSEWVYENQVFMIQQINGIVI